MALLAATSALVLAAGLTGCGSTLPGLPADAAASAPTAHGPGTPAATFEREQRERAQAAAQQARWGDAALAWELLTVLRPDSAEYRSRLAETRARIDQLVAERLPRAAAAAQRAELDSAMQQYLAVLALQPGNAVAADALRALERERNRRHYLGKFSRHTLTRRAFAEAEMPPGIASAQPQAEHAALLANDGEYDEAIALLERYAQGTRRDPSTRRLLAGIYQRKAEALLPRDRAGAIAALDKSLRLQPDDAAVIARLRQLRGDAPPAPPAVGGGVTKLPPPSPVSTIAPAR